MTNCLPLQLLLATFAGWVNRRQAEAIEYLVEENRVLKEERDILKKATAFFASQKP